MGKQKFFLTAVVGRARLSKCRMKYLHCPRRVRARVPTSVLPRHMEPPESLTNTNTERLTGSGRAGDRRGREATERPEMRSREAREGRAEAGGTERNDTGETAGPGGSWRAARLT